MGKYDGINVAEVTLIDFDRGVRELPGKRRLLFPLLRYAAAAVLVLLAFSGRMAVPIFESISAFIKTAVTFELPFMQSDQQPGEGVIAAYIESEEGNA